MEPVLRDRVSSWFAGATRGATIGLPVVLVLLATGAIFFDLRQTERERLDLVFTGQTRSLYNGVHESFNVYMEVVQSITSFFAANDQVTSEQFDVFVERDLVQFNGIQALEWIPRVPHDQREAYEEAVRNGPNGDSEFGFKQWTPNSDSKWTASQQKWADEYFPVYYMQPFDANKLAFGIDLASNPTRLKALERSRDSGAPVATARITLAQETGDQAGFLIFVPVYHRSGANETVAERRENLRGFALGVFRVGDIVHSALADLDMKGVSLRIFDLSAEQDKQLLYSHGEGKPVENDAGPRTTFDCRVGGREWQFRFTADPVYLESRRGWQSWFVLIGGLLIAFLIGLIINIVLGKAKAIEEVVQDRTKALNEAIDALAANEQRLQESQARLAEHANRLQASNGELEQFAYIASHDLQEPLRKVGSFCGLLKDNYGASLDEDANVYLDYVMDGAARMKGLISDLLSLSRVSAQAIASDPTDSNEAAAAAIMNLQMAIEESNAVVTQGDLPMVVADGRQLTQLLQNLVGNAIKYRDEKRTPEIHVDAQSEGNEWVFSVRDNGIGINEKYLDKVFEIFKRLHGRGDYSGTGIGLAICKKIVKQLNGKIWVESEEGVGSTFRFTLKKVSSAVERPLKTDSFESSAS